MDFRHSMQELEPVAEQLIELHPTLLAGYVELCRVLVMGRKWDKIGEVAQQATLIQVGQPSREWVFILITCPLHSISSAISMIENCKPAKLWQTVLNFQSECIPIQLFECFESLASGRSAEQTESLLADLHDSVVKTEASNFALCLSLARLLDAVALDSLVVRQFAK